MKKRQKALTMILSLTLAAALGLSGCGSAKDDTANSPDTSGTADTGQETAGANTDTGEMHQLTILAPQIANIIDIETNDFTKWYEEQTNTHISWQLVPQDAIEANLNLVLAGGEYPDIFLCMEIKTAMEGTYGGEDKIFRPLDDLIENEMPNLKKYLDENPNVKKDITALDGHIYTFPSISEYTHVKYAQKMWINKEWLDHLGLDMPKTTDELYEVLKAFKEKDPNGNGIADEVPLSGAPNIGGGWHSGIDNFIMNAFIYDSGYYYSELRDYVNGDTVEVSVIKDEYKEGLKYLHKLYSEGLIDPACFTNTNDQLKQIALNPDVPLLGMAPSGHPAMFCDITADHDRYVMYEALAPLEGPSGYRVATKFDDVVTPGEAAISTTCQNPEAAARWIDGFYEYEVSMSRKYGLEGVGWRDAEQGELGLGGEPALYKLLKDFDESAQNENWAWFGVEFIPAELMEGSTVTPENVDLKSAEGFEKMLLTVTEEKYIPNESKDCMNLSSLIHYTEEEAERKTLLYADLGNLVKEYRAQFITGEKDIDAEWDSFVQGLYSMGLQEYLDIQNAAYERYANR